MSISLYFLYFFFVFLPAITYSGIFPSHCSHVVPFSLSTTPKWKLISWWMNTFVVGLHLSENKAELKLN